MLQKIRIKLKSYDHATLDQSAAEIVRTARRTGAVTSGPVPLPTRKTVYTVLRSPHVDKKSREQFEIRIHKRLIDITRSTGQTMEALEKLDIPAGGGIGVKNRVGRRRAGGPRSGAGERRRGIACASVKGLLEMMGLIGRKVGMTQLFDEKGDIVPVTVIEAGPCTVTEIRTGERDGYTALQLGFGTNKEKRFTKP